MMAKRSRVKIPWPGPRPYSEAEWRLFRGRAQEVARVINVMNGGPLTMLTGDSATGKTSLVRAGLVPELRNRRYHARGSLEKWPTLILRRWGAEGGHTVDEILLGQIGEAIKDIRRWGEQESQRAALQDAEEFEECLGDIAAPSEVVTEHPGASDRAVAALLTIAAKLEEQGRSSSPLGLILILDQFEEVLRPGGQTAAAAVRIVSDLYRFGQDTIKILISMRQEYLYALKDLEQLVGGLASRSVVLKPMTKPTMIEVVGKVANRGGLPISEDAAKQVVGWLKVRGEQGNGTAGRSTEKELGQQVASSPDLLRLQAVLWELFRFALEKEKTTVTAKVVKEFLGENDEEPARLVDGALERWVEYAIRKDIKRQIGKQSSNGVDEDSVYERWLLRDACMDRETLDSQVRRIAVRIGPNLSSMDYKVPQEENVLFRLSMGEEIWRLGMKDARKKKLMEITSEDPPRLNSESLGLQDQVSDSSVIELLAGVAKRQAWSPARTGNELAVCFRETLDRLARGNVLLQTKREIEGSPAVVWELVHDQFGPAFANWGRDNKDTWRDCEGSIVICNGVQPITVREGYLKPAPQDTRYVVRDVSWRGCKIEPIGEEGLVLEDVEFEDCFLTGTVFQRCVFKGGVFRRCVMNGGLFVECEFLASECGKFLCFEACEPRSLGIIESAVEGLEFRDCKMYQPTLGGCSLSGDVKFSGRSRVVQGFFDFDRLGSVGAVVFSDASRGFMCSGSERCWGYVKMDREAKLLSEPLPGDFLSSGEDKDLGMTIG